MHNFSNIVRFTYLNHTVDIIKTAHIYRIALRCAYIHDEKKSTVVDTIDDKHICKYGIEYKKKIEKRIESERKTWEKISFFYSTQKGLKCFASFGFCRFLAIFIYRDRTHVNDIVVIAKPHTIHTHLHTFDGDNDDMIFLRLS